jgi:hypothetical protein
MGAREKAFAVSASVFSVPLAYLLAKLCALPMLWLDPERMAWSFGSRPAALAMDFYGRAGFALLCGLFAYVLAGQVVHRMRVPAKWLQVCAALSIAALLTCLGYEIARVTPEAVQLALALR